MGKRCRWTGLLCDRSSCSEFDCSTGNVMVCEKHNRPSAFFKRKYVKGGSFG
jgi:hypothetical protein